MPKKKQLIQFNKRDLIYLVIIVFGLYVLLPQFSAFSSSWHLLSHPDLKWVWAALGLTAITYFMAAATYCFLSLKPLAYVEELLIQLAAMFVNRILPAGIGALGANYEYLRHKKHTLSSAASIVAINNILGAAGHVLLVVIALTFFTGHGSLTPSINLSSGLKTVAWIVGVGAVLIAVFALITSRNKVKSGLVDFAKQLLTYRHHPWRMLLALASQMGLSLANFLCLSVSCLAIGVHVPYEYIVIIFSIGVGTRAVSPTPGGLGGFEAGLVAGLVAYHVPSAQALAAVLLFRLANYWLPLAFGAAAFIFAERKKMFSY